MATPEIWTLKDVLDHLLLDTDQGDTNRAREMVRSAIASAYRQLPNERLWSYYRAVGRITTSAAYSTGTVEYTHSTRELELTDGTWPSWAALGHVLIDNVRYQVAERSSDTVVILSPSSNPGDDIAAGETYSLFREAYELPIDFGSMGSLLDLGSGLSPTMVGEQEWLAHNAFNQSPQQSCVYTISGSAEYFGAMVLRLAPPPSDVKVLDFVYRRTPRPMRLEGHGKGDVSFTSSSATITGNGTAWTSDMEGAIIRFSDGVREPSRMYGTQPYFLQRTVVDVASATSMTVDAVMPVSGSAVKYLISDPLDLDIPVMLDPFLRLCEAQHGYLRAWNPGVDPESQRARAAERRLRTQEYREALRLAFEADNRSHEHQVVGGGGYRGSGHWDNPVVSYD